MKSNFWRAIEFVKGASFGLSVVPELGNLVQQD
jgi:hypothetical protein